MAIKIRFFLCVALAFVIHSADANMASPWQSGTQSASAYSSSDIDLVHEHILIAVNAGFTAASYTITYTVQSDVAGNRIPLVFYAMDYAGDFRIWVDDKPVQWQQADPEHMSLNDSLWRGFHFPESTASNTNNPFTLSFGDDNSAQVEVKDLKYFVADLATGTHQIRVQYTANAWINRSNWIKNYSFRYALSPAKYWKSFGGLDIDVQLENNSIVYTSNLSGGTTKPGGNVQSWHFDSLPSDAIVLSYTPQVTGLAKLLLTIKPGGLTIIAFLVLLFLHIALISKFRKIHPAKSGMWFITIGCVFVPVITLLFYLFSFGWIDEAIGPHASDYHGYTFMVLLVLPIAIPVYYVLIRLLLWLKKSQSL